MGIDMKEVYDYQPIPKGLDEDKKHFVLGSQANLWSEYISTNSQSEYMIYPRLAALSEAVWSTKESRDWNDFSSRISLSYA